MLQGYGRERKGLRWNAGLDIMNNRADLLVACIQFDPTNKFCPNCRTKLFPLFFRLSRLLRQVENMFRPPGHMQCGLTSGHAGPLGLLSVVDMLWLCCPNLSQSCFPESHVVWPSCTCHMMSHVAKCQEPRNSCFHGCYSTYSLVWLNVWTTLTLAAATCTAHDASIRHSLIWHLVSKSVSNPAALAVVAFPCTAIIYEIWGLLHLKASLRQCALNNFRPHQLVRSEVMKNVLKRS